MTWAAGLSTGLTAHEASRDAVPDVAAPANRAISLLVSPALLTAIRAGRLPGARDLWVAVVLVAIPVFLYYGGGFAQYGFRYSLDFTPFLVALMALGASRGFGRLDQFLITASIVSVTYGVVWHVRGGTA